MHAAGQGSAVRGVVNEERLSVAPKCCRSARLIRSPSVHTPAVSVLTSSTPRADAVCLSVCPSVCTSSRVAYGWSSIRTFLTRRLELQRLDVASPLCRAAFTPTSLAAVASRSTDEHHHN